MHGGDGSPVAGGEGEAAAGLLHPLAHPRAATASGGDGGDGAVAQPETAGGGGELDTRGAAARRHGRGRERGQTKEGDEGMLYIGLD
mgnify:CR=1 FL=1